ncbi:hypothetical protein V1507DRAFT_379989, partial [Lipomyces tetrasporus]
SPTQRAIFANAMAHIKNISTFGPFCTTSIGTALIEVHQRDVRTNGILRPRKYVSNGKFVAPGDRLHLGITIGDLFPPDDEQIDDFHSEPGELTTAIL